MPKCLDCGEEMDFSAVKHYWECKNGHKVRV